VASDSISEVFLSLLLCLVIPEQLKMVWDTLQHCLRLRA